MTNPVPPACPRGHALELPDDRFCQVCGITVRCSQGHPIDEVDAAFCAACGEALPVAASSVARTPSRGLWLMAGVVGGLVIVVVAGMAVFALGGGDDDDVPVAPGGDVDATPTLTTSSPRATQTPTTAPTAAVAARTPTAVATPDSETPAVSATEATAAATSPAPIPTPLPPTATSTSPPATATPTTPPPTAVATGECHPLNITPVFHESVQNPPPVESVEVTRSPLASSGCPPGEYREGERITLTTEAIPGTYPVWGASQESATRLECTHCQTTTLTMKGVPFFFVGPLYFAE
ncbi:MAG: hypothetical protein Kow0010_03730 [Dehalococcoidia bacterium]